NGGTGARPGGAGAAWNHSAHDERKSAAIGNPRPFSSGNAPDRRPRVAGRGPGRQLMDLLDKLTPLADRVAEFAGGPIPFDTTIDEVCGPTEVMIAGRRTLMCGSN